MSQSSIGNQVHIVSLAGDPERIAAQLIEPQLPRTFLDDVDVSTEGQAQLIASLLSRQGKASIEKDEIIRFVERNRSHLETTLSLLSHFEETAKSTENTGLSKYLTYIEEQLRFAYYKEYDKINVRSDRLFWLIYVLASQLASNELNYDNALSILERPHNRERISARQLLYMVFDYADSVESPNQPPTEMMILIGAAAQMASLTQVCHKAFRLTLRLGNFGNPQAAIDYLNNSHAYLAARVQLEADDLDTLERIQRRYSRDVASHDF